MIDGLFTIMKQIIVALSNLIVIRFGVYEIDALTLFLGLAACSIIITLLFPWSGDDDD